MVMLMLVIERGRAKWLLSISACFAANGYEQMARFEHAHYPVARHEAPKEWQIAITTILRGERKKSK